MPEVNKGQEEKGDRSTNQAESSQGENNNKSRVKMHGPSNQSSKQSSNQSGPEFNLHLESIRDTTGDN
jgi:hypothetical protein